MSAETIAKIKSLIDERTQAAVDGSLAAKPFMDRVADLTAEIKALALPLVELKDEGSVSLDIMGAAKVKFTKEVSRKADTQALQESWADLPEAVTKAFKFEAGIDLKALRALGEADAVVAAQFYKSTTSDAKMSIELKAVQK